MFANEYPPAPKIVQKATIEKTTRGVRFTLHDVQGKLNKKARPVIPAKEAFSQLLESPLEASSFEQSPKNESFLNGTDSHPLILSAFIAYAEHRPLLISPDAVFLTIVQGLAHHVNNYPEKYRDKLVDHKGTKTLCCDVVGFVPGSHRNPWPIVIEEFCKQLPQQQKGDRISQWSQPEFSTTGPIERAAFRVAFMGMMKPYHDFVVRCICGIPTVELTGTVEDWREIERRLELLDEFDDLGWWTASLKPICRHFVLAAEGRVDLEHWSKIIKNGHTYGTELIDGWLAKLVPYLVDCVSGEAKHRNSLLTVEEHCEGSKGSGISPRSLPKGVSLVPFRLEHADGSTSTMELIAGLAGIGQTEEGALEARMGWAVRPRPSLSFALDELERRGLVGGSSSKVDSRSDRFGFDGVAAEIIELQDRCRGGARLCTKSGHVCGRVFPAEERTVTRYVREGGNLEKEQIKGRPSIMKPLLSSFGKKNERVIEKGVFETKREEEWKSYSTLRHHELGRVTWNGIGEIDGKTVGLQMSHPKNKVFLFSAENGTDDFYYEELPEKDLSTLILEVLNRP